MMNFHKATTWALVILAVLYIGGVTVNAQSPMMSPMMSPSMAPAADCMTLIYNMSDCLTYVEQGSNLTKPDKNCCPELAGMLDSNPMCLCNLLGKSQDFPVALDLKKALKLPTVCKVDAPSVSLCSAIGMPVGGPAASPTSGEGPSSAVGMSPTALDGLAPALANGAAKSYGNQAFLVASLAIALASLLSL